MWSEISFGKLPVLNLFGIGKLWANEISRDFSLDEFQRDIPYRNSRSGAPFANMD